MDPYLCQQCNWQPFPRPLTLWLLSEGPFSAETREQQTDSSHPFFFEISLFNWTRTRCLAHYEAQRAKCDVEYGRHTAVL